jgi:hypothetical protein
MQVAPQRRFRRLRIGEARQELRGGGSVERAGRGGARSEGNLERQIWEGAVGERLFIAAVKCELEGRRFWCVWTSRPVVASAWRRGGVCV